MRILFVLLLCCLIGISYGFERRSEGYKQALLATSDRIAAAYRTEYRKYVETGQKSAKLKAMNVMLRPTKSVRRLEIENIALEEQALLCIMCRSVGSVFLEYRHKDNMTDDQMKTLAIGLCKELQIQPDHVCEGLIDKNLPIILYIVDNRKSLNEAEICGVVLQGSNCAINNPDFDWSLNIDSNGGEITESKKGVPAATSDDLTILHVTDVHVDLEYQQGSNAECQDPICCRASSSKTGKIDAVNGAGKWGDYRDCDVPWAMYEDALHKMRKTHQKIDYLYFTGDIVDHAIWDTSYQGNRKSIQDTYKHLHEVFPDTQVYPLIGNHESEPLNLFAPDYVKGEELSTQWLYDFIASEWARWLPESALETVKKGGYYTLVPKKGFRIIALNNNDCYTFNFWLLLDPKYPSIQLQWLHDTLLEAEKAGEYVHLLAHIPSGEGSYFNTCAREFRRVVDRFHKTISGMFVGHTHFDEFNVYYARENSAHAVNVVWNGGSLTPFSFVNPNYRTYSVEQKSYQVVDHDTWIFNLTAANLNENETPEWYKSYSFSDHHKISDLSPHSLDGLMKRFSSSKDELTAYWEHKVKQGDASLRTGCDDKCLKGHLCEAVVTQSNDVAKCEELTENYDKTVLKKRY